jgi:hypothetical protein
MIRKFNRIRPNLAKYLFSSDHHDLHETVVINSSQNWISNPDISNSKVAIFGFSDMHDSHHHDEYSDPYPHLRSTPFLSLNRLVFADPYYHADEDEPLMNTPHGYLTNDDPLDPRNNFERPMLEFLVLSTVALVLGVAFGNQGLYLIPAPNRLYNAVLTAD